MVRGSMAGTRLARAWRRLDGPGVDAVVVEPDGDGHRLHGAASFVGEDGPVALAYDLRLGEDWSFLRGRVSGVVGDDPLRREIVREGAAWTLDGRPQPDVTGLVELDLWFTPATNLPTMRRLSLAVGAPAEAPVAWLRPACDALERLPQTYERLDATRVAYTAPTVGYADVLVLDDACLVRLYPGLWEAVPMSEEERP